MGFVMDAVVERAGGSSVVPRDVFEAELSRLRPYCHWTSGAWDLGGGVVRAWDDVQNTSRDIQLVTNHLLQKYRQLNRALAG
jgi:hypothetical protein